MLCQYCKKKPATLHSFKNINGKQTETHLCQECYNLLHSKNISNVVNDLAGELFDLFTNTKTEKLVCQTCGTREEELSVGYVGCEDCYKVFGNILLPIIKQVQFDTQHNGKHPLKQFMFNGKGNEILKLEKELELAKKEERYEDAIILREKIKKLRGEHA